MKEAFSTLCVSPALCSSLSVSLSTFLPPFTVPFFALVFAFSTSCILSCFLPLWVTFRQNKSLKGAPPRRCQTRTRAKIRAAIARLGQGLTSSCFPDWTKVKCVCDFFDGDNHACVPSLQSVRDILIIDTKLAIEKGKGRRADARNLAIAISQLPELFFVPSATHHRPDWRTSGSGRGVLSILVTRRRQVGGIKYVVGTQTPKPSKASSQRQIIRLLPHFTPPLSSFPAHPEEINQVEPVKGRREAKD